MKFITVLAILSAMSVASVSSGVGVHQEEVNNMAIVDQIQIRRLSIERSQKEKSEEYLEMLKSAEEYGVEHSIEKSYLTEHDMKIASDIIGYINERWCDLNDVVSYADFEEFVTAVASAYGLDDIYIEYVDGAEDSYGSKYSLTNNTLIICTRMKDEEYSLLFGTILPNEMASVIHEMRHAYQYKCAFVEGFNSSYTDEDIEEIRDNIINYYQYDVWAGNNDLKKYQNQSTEMDANLFCSFIVSEVFGAVSY